MKSKRISIILVLTFIAGLTTGCTVPPEKAQHVLKGAGYTDIKLRGRAWYDCGEGDGRATEFTAKGPNGQHVQGAVCCGLLAKNCTIRLD